MRFLPLETFFSNVSKLLAVITLDSLLIFLVPSLFQEASPWGKGGWSSSGSFFIRVLAVRCIYPGMLFFWFCLDLSGPGPVCQGVHGVWIMGRLVLRFEGIEEFHSSLLLAAVFEVDPLCMACQVGLLSFRIVARSI